MWKRAILQRRLSAGQRKAPFCAWAAWALVSAARRGIAAALRIARRWHHPGAASSPAPLSTTVNGRTTVLAATADAASRFPAALYEECMSRSAGRDAVILHRCRASRDLPAQLLGVGDGMSADCLLIHRSGDAVERGPRRRVLRAPLGRVDVEHSRSAV